MRRAYQVRLSVRGTFRQTLLRRRTRIGKALTLFVVALPALVGMCGLVVDFGMVFSERQNLTHACDAASTAAAMDLTLGRSFSVARTTAESFVGELHPDGECMVTTNSPPLSGRYAGRSGFVEVVSTYDVPTNVMQALGAAATTQVRARSVAGAIDSTGGAAVVALDPDPPAINVGITLPIPLNFPALIGGLEIEGVGPLRVDGAVHVNTKWGGVDENGLRVGETMGPPYGIACLPVVPLARMRATDVRVAGGVDNRNNFSSLSGGGASPLKANRLPVPDPFRQLPAVSKAADAANVDTTLRGGARIATLPILGPLTTLRPGVYDYIEIISGPVVFEPGVYIIRGVSPLTGIALSVVGGTVTADGVMFYITNSSSSFNATTGAPDSGDPGVTPAAPFVTGMLPSVLINAALPGNRYTSLQTGPFAGMLIHQRRNDYRPIVIVSQGVLGSSVISGTIYAKYGHVIFAANGTYQTRIVAGSVRFAPVLGITLSPTQLLDPARDVYLVE